MEKALGPDSAPGVTVTATTRAATVAAATRAALQDELDAAGAGAAELQQQQLLQQTRAATVPTR